jgi:pimeloyl-ACP methyl ester carboxylesterase
VTIAVAVLAIYAICSAAVALRILYPGIGAPRFPLPAGMASQAIRVEGTTVEVSVHLPDPRAPVCVLQHGLGQSRGTLAAEADLLARFGFGVVMMDLPGHGGSDRRATTFGGREARLLRQVLDRLGVAERVTVLWGRSVGAATVLRAASTLPGVQTVVLECMFDNPLRTVTRHAVAHPRFLPLLPLLPGVLLVLWVFLLVHGAHRFPIVLLPTLSVPLLVVAGSRDVGSPPEVQARLLSRSRHPSSRMAIVAEALHYECFARAPEIFEDWLERYSGSSVRPSDRQLLRASAR